MAEFSAQRLLSTVYLGRDVEMVGGRRKKERERMRGRGGGEEGRRGGKIGREREKMKTRKGRGNPTPGYMDVYRSIPQHCMHTYMHTVLHREHISYRMTSPSLKDKSERRAWCWTCAVRNRSRSGERREGHPIAIAHPDGHPMEHWPIEGAIVGDPLGEGGGVPMRTLEREDLSRCCIE
jgi:hypothetical protein